MLKWVVALCVIAGFVYWLLSGRRGGGIADPEVKELDQKRFYVTPPSKGDSPPDDHERTRL